MTDNKIRVINVYKEEPPIDNYIYIGRSSKWGNPFSHKDGTLAKYKVENREKAVDKYKDWIENGEGKFLLNDLFELRGKTLGCFCKPSKCHGDILLRLVKEKFG